MDYTTHSASHSNTLSQRVILVSKLFQGGYQYCTALKYTTFMSCDEMMSPKELPYTNRMDSISKLGQTV